MCNIVTNCAAQLSIDIERGVCEKTTTTASHTNTICNAIEFDESLDRMPNVPILIPITNYHNYHNYQYYARSFLMALAALDVCVVFNS